MSCRLKVLFRAFRRNDNENIISIFNNVNRMDLLLYSRQYRECLEMVNLRKNEMVVARLCCKG